MGYRYLYPDVDPATPLPLTAGERIALSVCVGVMAFGAAWGMIEVTVVACAAFLGLLGFSTLTTRRRIRNEARTRFPAENWAENEISPRRPVLRVVGVLAGVVLLILGVSTFAPASYALTFATATGLVASGLMYWALR